MATETQVTMHAHKRWFFWPAAATIVVLGHMGAIKDMDRWGHWLAVHAIRIKVRGRG